MPGGPHAGRIRQRGGGGIRRPPVQGWPDLVAGRSFRAICRHPHRCYQYDGAANLANALFRTLFLPIPSNLYHGLMADLVPWVMYGCLLLACLVQCLVACMIGWVAFGPALISDVWFLAFGPSGGDDTCCPSSRGSCLPS
jgi:hypothetical protein